MIIRKAVLADLEAIAQIERISYPEAEGASKESIRKRLEIFADHFWIMENEQSEITGFVNGMVTNEPNLTDEMYDDADMHDESGDWQMIFSVVTAPKYRGKGYAGQIMKQVILDAETEGRKGVVLTCKEHLIPFYASFGFENEGVSESVHGNAVWYQMRCIIK